MTTEAGITGGEVAAEVMIDMSVTGTVGETGTIVAEAGAAVPVLITRVVDGDAMMMSVIVEAGADLWIGLHSLILGSFSFDFSLSLLLFNFFFWLFPTAAPLCDTVLVLEGVLPLRGVFPHKGVLPPEKVHGVKVLIIVAVMESLLHLAVSHHVVALMLLEAHLLEIQMVM